MRDCNLASRLVAVDRTYRIVSCWYLANSPSSILPSRLTSTCWRTAPRSSASSSSLGWACNIIRTALPHAAASTPPPDDTQVRRHRRTWLNCRTTTRRRLPDPEPDSTQSTTCQVILTQPSHGHNPLFDLVPAPRDAAIAWRVRSAHLLPVLRTRTSKYRSSWLDPLPAKVTRTHQEMRQRTWTFKQCARSRSYPNSLK